MLFEDGMPDFQYRFYVSIERCQLKFSILFFFRHTHLVGQHKTKMKTMWDDLHETCFDWLVC